MFVVRLRNGNLLAPESAMDYDGEVMGDAYVEISPADPAYSRLARHAVSEEELDQRRQRWREGDEALRREFESYLAERAQENSPPGTRGGPPA